MKKTFILFILVLFTVSMVFLGTSCKEEAAPAEEAVAEEEEKAVVEEEVEEAAPAEEIKLVYWTHDFAPIIETVTALIPLYEAEHPNITIEYINFPWTEFETALAIFLQTGEGPDLFGSGDRMLANWVEAGLVAPMDYEMLGYSSMEEMEADFIPGSLDFVSIDGIPYGPHVEFNSQALYINTDHFEEVGLDPETDYPKTWDELAEVAKQLVILDDEGNFVREGFDFNYTGDADTIYQVTPILAQFGASIFNEDRSESLLNSPEAIEAFKMMQSLVWEHKVGSPKAGGVDPYYAQQDFVNEQTSIMTGMNWMEPTLEGEPIGEHYKVVPFPQKEGGTQAAFAYAWHFAVNTNSQHQDEAWKFIDFLSSNQVLWYQNSRFIHPRHPEWMSSPEAEKIKTPYFDLFVEAMEYGVTGEYITNYTDYYQIIWKAFQDIMYNNADVEETLNNAKAELDAAIALW